MSQVYSNPKRASDPHALPDVETFQVYTLDNGRDAQGHMTDENSEPLAPGWYWWSCFPGCLPDGDPIGPFATEQEAIDDAQEGCDDDDDPRCFGELCNDSKCKEGK